MPSHNEIGRRIAAARTARRLTQPDLASLAHISLSLLRKIEQGRRGATDPVLDALADALGIEPERLTGDRARAASRVHDAIPGIRRAVDAYDCPDDGPIRPLADLRRAVDDATAHRLASKYSRLAEEAPALLGELARAVDTLRGDDRRTAAALMAEAYRAADAVAYKTGYHDLSARMVETMRWAAGIADDPTLTATIAYVRTEIFFASRNLGPGLRALEAAVSRAPAPSGPGQIAALGALHMRAAVTAARHLEDEAVADEHMEHARRLAALVPEGVYGGTAFGPESMLVHEVSVAVELGDGARAIQAAGGAGPGGGLPAERRSHFWIELARAQLWAGQRDAALQALQEARRAAPQHVREHPHVREALGTLLRLHLAPAQQLLSYVEWAGAV